MVLASSIDPYARGRNCVAPAATVTGRPGGFMAAASRCPASEIRNGKDRKRVVAPAVAAPGGDVGGRGCRTGPGVGLRPAAAASAATRSAAATSAAPAPAARGGRAAATPAGRAAATTCRRPRAASTASSAAPAADKSGSPLQGCPERAAALRAVRPLPPAAWLRDRFGASSALRLVPQFPAARLTLIDDGADAPPRLPPAPGRLAKARRPPYLCLSPVRIAHRRGRGGRDEAP